MRVCSYIVGGKNYGVTARGWRMAMQAAKETGLPIRRWWHYI